MQAGQRQGTGGRPTAAGAIHRTERILEVATAGLLRDGFAATSLEAVAAGAGVSKRTLYARFPDKQALALAVVRRLVDGWLPGFEGLLGGTLADALLAAARRILTVALTPDALALRRLVISESGRFPELAAATRAGGTRTGMEALARLLGRHRPDLSATELAFLAEQFQHLVVAGPLARMAGNAPPMAGAEAERWCADSVRLFLGGLAAAPGASSPGNHVSATT